AYHSAQDVDVTLQVFTAKSDSLSLMNEITANLIDEAVALQGTSQQTLSILADSVKVWRTDIQIPDPLLWSPLHPHLYILKVIVTQNGVIKDEFYTQFGVRTIKAIEDKIFLNGKPLFLHGVARHEEHPSYGRSLPIGQIIEDIKIIKGVKANYLRSGHYPNHPFTYVAADRYGLMVMEEIPVWWFDGPKEWFIQNYSRLIHLQMFREMAFRDFNRPSIAMWSTSNECKEVAERAYFVQMVQSELDSQYPDGRLITQSAAADRPGPYDNSQTYSDVAGWTMYFGVFYNPYGLGIATGTRHFMVDAHDYFPTKPVVATEYGYWSGEDMSQFNNQVKIFDSTFAGFQSWLPMKKNGVYNSGGFIAGITWWCIFDWYSHQHSAGFQSMGLMRMNRGVEKPVMAKLRSTYGAYAGKSEYITAVVKSEPLTVSEFALEQNYPNPFNPSTVISFSIPQAEYVQVKIFNVLGGEVATIVDAQLAAGKHLTEWNAQQYASGIYFCRIIAGKYSSQRKMMYLK
ncbi:MAG: glycoside hydrolase family 2 TIM barrel-domain containing protein, partial [Bacteriovoracaceae bacterium]